MYEFKQNLSKKTIIFSDEQFMSWNSQPLFKAYRGGQQMMNKYTNLGRYL